uniref:Mannitol-specific phosphotransferase enzyme IIA component n=1 Tax=Candidatus Actinomarina minuta TaxID=1389454 RepID=S5DN80_9ACTN|nr:mannitol/fructose-specific phosphotransferase system, IIA domain [Candidatus Actinomarina minuta]|tara:strand:+ start:123 stop:566 length:444 start_codon:yes stop_codon:yes gene_type:complete
MSQKSVLIKESILTNKAFLDNKEATIAAGNILLENGYVKKEYIASMLEKLETQSFATYIGNGVAIPHGMAEGSKYVNTTGISVIQVPDGVDWNEEKAYIIVGIAANSDDHMNVLASLADSIEDLEEAKKLWSETSVDKIYELLSENI